MTAVAWQMHYTIYKGFHLCMSMRLSLGSKGVGLDCRLHLRLSMGMSLCLQVVSVHCHLLCLLSF